MRVMVTSKGEKGETSFWLFSVADRNRRICRGLQYGDEFFVDCISASPDAFDRVSRSLCSPAPSWHGFTHMWYLWHLHKLSS